MRKQFDRNGDGVLDASERQAAKAARLPRRYQRLLSRLDANRDGVLSLSEIQAKGHGDPARMLKRFRAADANRDGVVTQREFVQAAGQMRRGHRRHR